MARLILRYRGPLPIPPEDVERLTCLPELVIVDRSPRMLLVDGPTGPVEQLVGVELTDWVVSLEHTVELPDPRPRPRRSRERH